MKPLPLTIAFTLALAGAAPAFSLSMLVDFGPVATGTESAKLNSPGHASGDVSALETSWNQVQTADVASGLVFADGSAANGVGIDIGTETTSSSNVIGFATQPTSSLLGNNGAYSTGVYGSADAPARDFIFNSFNSEPWAIGLKVTGLAAGTYKVYVTGANVNGASAGTMNFFADALAFGAASYDFSAVPGVVATNLSSESATWSAGVNYAVMTVSISEGQALALAASGTGTSSGGRGFLNSLEIVRVSSIPEPGAYATILGGLALAGCVAARRGGRA